MDVDLQPNYSLWAAALLEDTAIAEANRAQISLNQTFARQAKSSRLPPTTSSIAQALNEWVRTLMGIAPPNNNLPSPPSPEELQLLLAQKIDQKTNTLWEELQSKVASPSSGPSRQTLSVNNISFLQKTSLKNIARNQPKVVYTIPATQNPIATLYSASCLSYAQSSMQAQGISRCTLEWNSGAQSAWNQAVIQQLWLTWLACDEGGGTSTFTIPIADNNPANCQAIIQRWFQGRKTEWKKQENAASGKSTEKPRNQSSLKVSFYVFPMQISLQTS